MKNIIFIVLFVVRLVAHKAKLKINTMGVFQVGLILFGLAYQALGAALPQNDGSTNLGIPPFLSFKDGTIGVNFLGFKASAGLGGILSGDATQGGLHAEAETPFGQKAGAGLGGRVDGNGRAIGGMYAGATAGGGVGALASLDGVAGANGAAGRKFAGAAAGGVGTAVVKETVAVPVAGATISGSVNIQKVVPPPTKVDVVVVKENIPPPKSQVHIELIKEELPPPPLVKKTYVERTVIPNYVEKTIQVPSYVEKTIRVPTVVEKTIKVPAPPTIIEKEIEMPQPVRTVTKTKQVLVQQEEVPLAPPTTIVKTKTKIHRRPWFNVRKRININETPYYGGVVAGTANANAAADSVADGYGGFGAFGNFGYGSYGPPPPATYGVTTVTKQFNGNLFRDIFNIPIATLGAVSNLVGNIAGGVNGSVSVAKSYGAAYKK